MIETGIRTQKARCREGGNCPQFIGAFLPAQECRSLTFIRGDVISSSFIEHAHGEHRKVY